MVAPSHPGKQERSPCCSTRSHAPTSPLPAAGSGKYTTGMLEFLLNAADGILDDAPLYEQELREAEDEEFDDDE